MLAFVALLLVVVVGMSGAYWAYKKYRAKQRQEFRYEGKMMLKREGADPEALKKSMVSDAVLERVINDYDLVNTWELAHVDAAKARIREKFHVSVTGLEVRISYQDRDKELAHNLLKALVRPVSSGPKPRLPAAE